jgi:hypothetical protein
MTTADRIIRWTTALAVVGVAAVASYEHAYALLYWPGGSSAWVGHRGDAGGQRGPWPGARAGRGGGGCVVGGRAGRVLRVAHDGYPRFSSGAGWHARQDGSPGSASGAGGQDIRRSAGSRSPAVGSRDPRAAPRRPASCAATAGLPRCGSKAGGKPRCVNNLREAASSQQPRLEGRLRRARSRLSTDMRSFDPYVLYTHIECSRHGHSSRFRSG